jgi:hypothetical protein
MVRKRVPSVQLSSDPEDKRCACLNQEWASDAYAMAPDYFEACARWWNSLTPYQRDLGLDMISFHDRPEAVAQLAPELPSAPKFPDDAFDKWEQRGVTFRYPRRPRAR